MAVPDTIPGEQADKLAVVALGANLAGAAGDPAARLEAALARFSAHGLVLVKRSRLWRSAAWPDSRDPPFLNAVALVEPHPGPEPMLAALHAIEREFDRVRGERNAPRTLDLDLIAYGRTRLDTPALTLPHPRAAERLFVMGPLAEIAPAWRHPVSGRTASALARDATVGQDARPLQAWPNADRSGSGPERQDGQPHDAAGGRIEP